MAQTETLKLPMLRGIYARHEGAGFVHYGTSGETDPETGEYVQRHVITIDMSGDNKEAGEKLVVSLARSGFVDAKHPDVAKIMLDVDSRKAKLLAQGPRDIVPVVAEEQEPDIDTILAGKPEDVATAVKKINSREDLDLMREAEAKGKARTTVIGAIDAQIKKVSG